ncbi:MAG TPA: hypothetical protein VJ739_06575 [Gemmataceae bacterium]|nr:hypothetical protein [Gemmataceae bacterium]
MIRFSCPVCQQHLSARDDGAGQKVACAACGQRLEIPTPPKNVPPRSASRPAYRSPPDHKVSYATMAVIAVIGLKVLAVLTLLLILCIRLSLFLR